MHIGVMGQWFAHSRDMLTMIHGVYVVDAGLRQVYQFSPTISDICTV